MKLSDLLNAEDLFHPKVFYDGEWVLGGSYSLDSIRGDYLMLNAKKVNENNAYQEFLEEYYYKPMKEILDSDNLAHSFYPKISLFVDEKKEKRVVCFSLIFFLYQQFYALLYPSESMKKFEAFMKEHQTEEEWLEFLRQELRLDRKMFNDVLKLGQQSIHYKQVYQQYLDTMEQMNRTISLDSFLESKILAITKLIFGTRYYSSLFTKEIAIEPLVQAFDYDVFFLIAAKSSLDNCAFADQSMHFMNNCIGYVKSYLDAIEILKKSNPKYDCSMIILDSQTGHHKTISVNDVQKEYISLLSKYPEFQFMKARNFEMNNLLREKGLTEEEIRTFDLSIKSNQELLLELLEKLHSDKELAAEWEFIPKGKIEFSNPLRISSLEKSKTLSKDEKMRRMIIGKEYLENSQYVYKIYGIHKFEGYIGYIYSNGSVIFEKYYENMATKRVSSSSATYTMNLYNFLEMSKLSKTEIIRMIQSDANADVRRIFHRKDMERWKSEVDQVMIGSDYTVEVINYIDRLIAHKDIKKDKVK